MKKTGFLQAALVVLLLIFRASTEAQLNPPRAEHPRPDLMRADWQTLNGPWEFEFDDTDRGLAERWYAGSRRLSRTIQVPYCFQSKLSGIADPSFHDVVWYRRTFQVPPHWQGRHLLLHFGAVDYAATVWINGEQAASHRGGHVPFSCDISDRLKAGDNIIMLRAWDPSTDLTIPRGKQYWQPKSQGIFYTRTSGIWQPVWLEAVDAVHVKQLRITPDVDQSQVSVEVFLSRIVPDLKLRVTARLRDVVQAQSEVVCLNDRPATTLNLVNQQVWSPERPTLYDLTIELMAADKVLDKVDSYFGQRKVSVHAGKVYLNNAPYYLRLVLDQGYWPESTLTPPTDEAIQSDIKMAKAFGLNGARKHQKVEDPRWLYWCDKLGFLVWGEMANAHAFSAEYVSRFTDEWQQVIARDYNHPSIIVWVPINESWGVPRVLTSRAQQDHLKMMYHLIRSLDTTRPVVDNDGWEHTDATDLFTLHDYARTGEDLAVKYRGIESDRSHIPRNGREALAFGYQYNGTPILMTEFGGIAYRMGVSGRDNEWGYSGIEPTKEAMLQRLEGLVKALRANNVFAGYCYTQLTDVEQEINGLMTYDRKPKADPAEFAKIFK
ncbi:MAG TPA: glycoside hydrolase family 2 TIM barrel-domain containing protein [Acidobacteriota bacterium]|nr:glycoside hydrolase family 2 TIM barrel-domain containing protein [Acidobacteriota bacterium]